VGLGNIRSYKVRFTKQTWPGEELTTRVVVTGVRDEGDETLVDLDCSLANADGEVKVTGNAVALASRWG
jgi:acyl dehydratase